MPTLTKRKVGNNTYYYAVECQRIDGQPRLVSQKYLGSLDKIINRMTSPVPQPCSAEVFEYGACCALYSLARELDVVGTIDRLIPKREQGLSVGQYILLAALNRAIAPTSKRQIGEWYQGTSLYRFIPAKTAQLRSQRFWDHMGRLDADKIRDIEAEITSRMVDMFQLDLRCLIYDTSNFITWIDTMSEAELPQRGHSKEKRNDLKIVGLSLMLTTDFQIPLFHQIYPGNDPDSRQFSSVTEELVQRYKRLAAACNDVTLIFDKGNNSGDNIKAVAESPFHFVGSLKLTEAPELLDVPLADYSDLPGGDLAGTRAYRTRKQVLGAERTIVITYNEALYLGQLQGYLLRLRKLSDALKTLAKSLVDRATKPRARVPSVSAVEDQVKKALERFENPVRQWVRTKVAPDGAGFPQLDYHVDRGAMDDFVVKRVGKTILFTDQDAWNTEDIVRAYRCQWHVEAAFRQMKNPHFLSWEPQFHWTDQKIRVHAFYCILALTLANLTRRKLHQAGIDLTTVAILEQLVDIKEVLHIYPEETGIKARITLSKLSESQRRIMAALGIPDLSPKQDAATGGSGIG